jgi:hypothetical protein
MSALHERNLEAALLSIRRLWHDCTVDAQTTLTSLRVVADELDVTIDAVEMDIANQPP